MFYILTITEDSVQVIGAFDDEQSAADYGNAHIEDPRWNVITSAAYQNMNFLVQSIQIRGWQTTL